MLTAEIQDLVLLFGLLLNLTGSVALFAFDWDCVREFGYLLKPEYRRIDEGLYKLTGSNGELVPEDDGFDELFDLFIDDDDLILSVPVSDFERSRIQLVDNRQKVQFQLRDEQGIASYKESLDLPRRFVKEACNGYVRKGYTKFGGVFLVLGFGLQILIGVIRIVT